MKKLDYWDFNITIAYLVIHLFIFSSYYFQLLDRNIIKELYFVVGIISTFLVFDVFSKRFRKRRMFIIWFLIGLVQLIFYYKLRDHDDLRVINGTYIDWLKGVPAALIVSFILNLINKKKYGDHFIVTTFRLNPDEVIPGEDRQLRPTDYLFSIIGFITIILIVVLGNG